MDSIGVIIRRATGSRFGFFTDCRLRVTEQRIELVSGLIELFKCTTLGNFAVAHHDNLVELVLGLDEVDLMSHQHTSLVLELIKNAIVEDLGTCDI